MEVIMGASTLSRRRRRRTALASSLFAALPFVLSSGPAYAQSTPGSPAAAAQATPASPSDGVVSIGGQVVMRLRATAGGMDTAQRVGAIESRLTHIVAVP